MRTDEEILAKVREVQGNDPCEVRRTMLLTRLAYKKAKPYLRSYLIESRWKIAPRDRETILQDMYDFLPYAYGHVKSKSLTLIKRCMECYDSWVWLIGDDLGDLLEYNDYGLDNLERIREFYGWHASL